MAATGLISVPKQTLREMLAECAAVRTFLNVGSAAAALPHIYGSWIFGETEIQISKPFIIVSAHLLRMNLLSVTPGNNLWPNAREFKIEFFIDDPGAPQVVGGQVDPARIESGTQTLENVMGDVMLQLADLAGQDRGTGINSWLNLNYISLDNTWSRTDVESWPVRGPECYNALIVGVNY
jgi:hypothetical protein